MKRILGAYERVAVWHVAQDVPPQPQTLYRGMNLRMSGPRGFNPPRVSGPYGIRKYDHRQMADAILNHLKTYPHGTGGAGVWWTPHAGDAFGEGQHPVGNDFPVRMTAEWTGDPAHLDPNHGAAGPTWEGWKDEKVFHPGMPLNLTSLQYYDEGDPLRPRRKPWREVLRKPLQVNT